MTSKETTKTKIKNEIDKILDEVSISSDLTVLSNLSITLTLCGGGAGRTVLSVDKRLR